jgi:hypothetical protein
MVHSRGLVAEALGTAFLLAAIVGSGIMAEQLSGGNVGIALLCNSLATGAMLDSDEISPKAISLPPRLCALNKPRPSLARSEGHCELVCGLLPKTAQKTT